MTNQNQPWWKSPFQMFQTNLREIDVTLDAEAVLDDLINNGANAWLLNVGGILAHYPTELDCQTRNPALNERAGGDLVGDAVSAAHSRGIRILGRMDFSKVPIELAEKNPDWCFVGPDGNQQHYQGLVSVCPSAPYYQEHVFHILEEIMGRYALDGFFFNWFGFNEVDYSGVYHGVCHCEHCKAGFLAFSGKSLPDREGHNDYPEWVQYSRSVTDALTKRFVETIDSRLPAACLILGHSAHVLFHEANSAIGREFWPYRTLESVTALKATHIDKPVLVNSVAFYDMPYRMAEEETWMYRQYYLQAIAAGANVSSYIMGPTRNIRYKNVEQVSDLARFQNKWASKYHGLISGADIAIVRPDVMGSASELDSSQSALNEYHGWFQALSDRGIPFDVVAQEKLADTSLARYSAMILPHLPKVDDSQSAAIHQFVFDGGKLCATGGSGLSSSGGVDITIEEWLPVQKVEAITTEPEKLKSSYIALKPAPHDPNAVEGSEMLPIFGFHANVSWNLETKLHFALVPAAPFGPPEKAYGHTMGSHGALATQTIGAGQVLYIPFTPGRTYYEWGLQALGKFMQTALTTLLGYAPQVTAIGDYALSVTRQEQQNGDELLHVINTSGFGRSNCRKPITQFNVQFQITTERECELHDLINGQKIMMDRDGKHIQFTIPVLEEMAVIELRYSTHK